MMEIDNDGTVICGLCGADFEPGHEKYHSLFKSLERTLGYLGDGVYVSHDGYQFLLETDRRDGKHFIAVEPEILQAFFKYVESILKVKITVTPIEEGK
jgi:hypothetical protein